MSNIPEPPFLTPYWKNLFHLQQHLEEFLSLDADKLGQQLTTAPQKMTELGQQEFDWEKATDFYRDKVGENYLFDLAAWHLGSTEKIESTLLLIVDHAQGRVLDFGGGLGTHTICAAVCPQVEQVVYCDINPVHHDFVRYRAEKLGLSNKITFSFEMPAQESFNTIISFDVLEHLPDPCQQLLEFHRALAPEGKTILNWVFYKGYNQEYPFHLDDPQIVESFLKIIQSKFLEIFHPYYTTARCYRHWN
jgi:2-polyprenyl-3-methyl-5-hydroxy-6-metoxy-1,4-benzoquinol methylase